MAASENYYIGVDVGTGSARATIVGHDGTVLGSSTQETTTWRDAHDHRIFEQSSNNIWSCITTAIKEILAESKIPASAVKGVGFDATCSLAVTDMNGEPIVVTKGKDLGAVGDRNIILWADHRAEQEANMINGTGSIVLDYVGGTMSLEMELPKVLWLKKAMKPELFARSQFFDLPDWLTYRATGDSTRSCCSVTCKCSYVPNKGWQADFFEKVGLGDLVDGGTFKQMGAANGNVFTAGLPIGQGLSKKTAEEWGLLEGTPVGSGLIDAYAGWMGTVAARYKENGKLSDVLPLLDESRHRLAAVAGTSTCHIVQSPEGVFVPGVWGPYKDAVFPGWWMNEGGQSSTGQLIDFILTTHPAYDKLKKKAEYEKSNIHQVLQEQLEKLRQENHAESFTELCKDLHFYPDLHGNRSPLADSRMRGSFVGLELSDGLHDIARKYYLTLEAIALQNRHIIDEMNAKGHTISSIYMSGGQAKNTQMMQLFANTTGMPIVLPHSHSLAVVLGAAMLGRFAAEVSAAGGKVDDKEALWKIMVEMTPQGTAIAPNATAKEKKLLEAKYKIFRESIDIQRRWRQQMEDASK